MMKIGIVLIILLSAIEYLLGYLCGINQYPKKKNISAKDYIFVESYLGRVYLAEKTDSTEMSDNCRLVTDNEIKRMFASYLENYCVEHKTDTLIVTDDSNKQLFEVKLLNNREE